MENSYAANRERLKLEEAINSLAMKNFKCTYSDHSPDRYGEIHLTHLFMKRRQICIEYLKEPILENKELIMDMFIRINNLIKESLCL